MTADFRDAHDRHSVDAENLFKASRWANADHLFGLAAECGLKRLMQVFGMTVNAHGSPTDPSDRKHANDLWARYETYRVGHYAGTAYGLPDATPFSNWAVEQRYANQGGFDKNRVCPHRDGALAIRQLMSDALLAGLLE